VKIIEKNLQQGFVKVVPDSADDLWHLYNVIYKDDEVYAFSSRAIKSDVEYSRPKSAERVSAFMGVTVESVSWDKFLGRLRVHGLICHAPDIIPTGAHHTLSISLNKPLTIVKKSWAKHLLDRINRRDRVHMLYGDIRDSFAVRKALKASRPDYIFHLAAQSYPRTSFDSPIDTYETNIVGTAVLLESV